MKYTLLEMTQIVASSIDGDEVNSISDSVESLQIVKLIKRCYTNIIQTGDYPEQYTLFGLTASGDPDLPCVMYLPTGVATNVQWVKYDYRATGETDTNFRELEYVDLKEFLLRMHVLAPSEDSSLNTMTVEVGDQDIQFIYGTATPPSYYTTIDDETLIFDSYDSAVDTTLQTSKTLAYGEAVLSWTESDSYVIPIDDHQILLNQAIALAWAEMKQTVNAKAEQEIKVQKTAMMRKKHAIDPAADFRTMTPNYGRR